ncbi:MAG TPA: carboxylesterase family protein, partial [Candidatus Paceibacterota bacterium]
LNTLDANLAALNTAIQARDVATILHKMNEISILIQSMNTNVKTIQTGCQISPSGATPTPIGATPTSTALPQNTGISKCPAGLKNSISTTTGCVQGTYDPTTGREMFLGIPYAEPPVGDLRWKRPKTKTAWTTTLVAQESSPACMQQGQGYMNSLPGFGVTGPQSEDCLYLNIWRPAERKSSLPILFWIYGGGYVGGSGSSSMYAPNPDLASNAIVITFNYRLGTLGFLAHPDLSAENTLNISGNYGLYDIIEALKWVNVNAESLGGSRNQITIFGQSAGGNAVVSLLKTDLVAGLYTNAVAQSNTAVVGSASLKRGVPLKSGEEMGSKMSQAIGCSPAPSGMTVLRCLRKKTSQELTKAWTTVNKGNNDVTPYADGIISAGSYQRVPLVMGMTTEEFTTLSKAIGILKTRTQFEEQLRKEGTQMGVTDLDGLVKIYLPSSIGNDKQGIAEAFANYSWDTQFYCGARAFLKNYAAKTGMPTFGYLYGHAPSFFPAVLGAQHGSELFFLFGSSIWRSKFQIQERAMATNLQKAWTSFAKGAPVVEGVGAWPKFGQGNFVRFDLKSDVTSGIHLNQCDFLESQGIYRL